MQVLFSFPFSYCCPIRDLQIEYLCRCSFTDSVLPKGSSQEGKENWASAALDSLLSFLLSLTLFNTIGIKLEGKVRRSY